MMKRFVVSLCLALLAAAVPQVREAVLAWIGADNLIAPQMAAEPAGGGARALHQTGP